MQQALGKRIRVNPRSVRKWFCSLEGLDNLNPIFRVQQEQGLHDQ